MNMQSFFVSGAEFSKKRKGVEEKILEAASKVMYRNGFGGSSMNAIAQKAGVSEPTIYQYFKGKEDLLFSVVERQIEDSFLFLNEHLQGLNGAHNKLRKLIWAHLRYNDLNREYLTLILLECRSNLNFYQSRAYDLLRKYSGIILSILHEGIQEGVFRSDIYPRLVRSIILGLLDFEAYTVLVTGEIGEAVPDHEDIMRLLDRMLLRNDGGMKSQVEKKRAIIGAALRLFAEKGYAGATISEIAKSAGVSDGAVYEYFKNKEDLLLSIPEDRFSSHLEQLDETFNVQNPVRKLRRFIRDHFRLYLDDSNFLIVYLLLIQLNSRFRKSRAYDSVRRYMDVFENIVHEGIKAGSFTQDCNVRVYRNMFLGAFTHMSLRWFVVGEKERADKFKEISEFTNLLLDSINSSNSADQ